MKTLVLTEKPSVAREIARVLGCNINKNGGIIGDKYIITWALGHLVTLAMPEEMNKEWKEWNIETLPMIPKHFETRVIKETSKQFNQVKAFLKSDDVKELIIATDAGREGELVARWIINKVGFNKPMKRLWISSMTDKAISEGFKNLVDSTKYDRLYEAAIARAEADWLVGLNVTRALTCKYNASLSAGRVQTPTLSLIVDRENEIRKFTPKKYYTIHLKFKNTDFQLIKNNSLYQIYDEDEKNKILKEIKENKFKISDVKTIKKRTVPPLLYDLTSLQQDANKLYAFTAKYTLSLIQKLYETHKYLTYPRTDSKCLSTDMISTIKERLINASYGEFTKYANEILKSPLNTSKRIFDNSKVSDHHAIIPTELKPIINSLDSDEKRIYDLVLKRFLAAFMSDYLYEVTSVYLTDGKYLFKATGTTDIDLGFKNIYQNLGLYDEEIKINSFTINETVSGNLATLKQGLTTPPDRFTEATLLYAMEHAGKYTIDESEKKALESSSGIGTPATRAEIIDRIFTAGYVELKGKSIYPKEKGIQLINLVPKSLKTVSLTAKQELNLEMISKGKKYKSEFIKDIITFTKDLTNIVINSNSKYNHENKTAHKCPNCGKALLDVTNKFGKSLVCMDKECGYRKVIYKISNLHCPTCHKKLKQIGDKEQGYFQCECGFKEKVSSFLSKLKENKQGMSNKAVRKFIEKENKDIPKNNPFADFFN